MRLDKTRHGGGQALRLAHALRITHATAMLALTGGRFIISASEKQRD
jgi:hypothetical protein